MSNTNRLTINVIAEDTVCATILYGPDKHDTLSALEVLCDIVEFVEARPSERVDKSLIRFVLGSSGSVASADQPYVSSMYPDIEVPVEADYYDREGGTISVINTTEAELCNYADMTACIDFDNGNVDIDDLFTRMYMCCDGVNEELPFGTMVNFDELYDVRNIVEQRGEDVWYCFLGTGEHALRS